MKKHTTRLMVTVLAGSVITQAPAETNRMPPASSSYAVAGQTNRFKSRSDRNEDTHRRYKTDQRDASEQRRLKFMERELQRIGVTEEQKTQIKELQKIHRKKMAANAQQIENARRKLSEMVDEGASMEVLEAAIQDVADAQADQLRILVKNRMEMERILGKEKNAEFMRNARAQFEKHGRRGGPPLPPRPGLPPQPEQPTEPPAPPQIPPSPGNNP